MQEPKSTVSILVTQYNKQYNFITSYPFDDTFTEALGSVWNVHLSLINNNNKELLQNTHTQSF